MSSSITYVYLGFNTRWGALNKKPAKTFILFMLGTLLFTPVVAQDKTDSLKEKSITQKALAIGVNLISTSQKDTIVNELSTDPFKPFENAVIRNIHVEFIGFEKSIYDSTKHIKKITTNIANALHSSTKEVTIRNHLFIKKHSRLNPYMLADNERFLRDLDFILDARLVVTPIEGSDSVDITVITRDVFSLGVGVGGNTTVPEVSIYDLNVGGRGQRVQFSGLIDPTRSPAFGYGVFYRKRSVLGSLINVELGYSQLNMGPRFGDEYEYTTFLNINRPLVSPLSRTAGGLEISNNRSVNVYNKPDSSFLDYQYKINDYWIGYNIGIKKAFNDRSRYFLALRYFDGVFIDTPDQEVYRELRQYNSIRGVLSEFTFYRKDYFKTRYVYGFGRTEDVPYGVTAAATIGYLRELKVQRPYGALKFSYSKANKRGDFFLLNVQGGGYVNNAALEDVLFNSTAGYYSRALNVNRSKVRANILFGFCQLFNQVNHPYIYVRKSEVRGFAADTLQGTQRLSGRFETTLYTPRSLFGFRFAPFTGLDWASLECLNCKTKTPQIFGINAGIRARNENLTFGTMELRVIYIPDDGTGSGKFRVEFRNNLRVKNSGTFADKPRLVYN